MKQQCNISFVYSSLSILVGGTVYFLLKGLYFHIILWIFFILALVWLYDRFLPVILGYLGYLTMDDEWANQLDHTQVNVILYTGLACPFCKIIKKRLKELQPRMDFKFKEVNITLKPVVVISKGIHALPVLEVGESRLVGNATSDQLVKFIMEASLPRTATAQTQRIYRIAL
jgi:glutaredoxin